MASGAKDAGLKIHFRVSYWTQWGQSLVLNGAGLLLGDWNPSRGLPMKCHHEGDRLIWECVVVVPTGRPYLEYHYSVVSEERGVEKEEMGHRRLILGSSLVNGMRVEVFDSWQVRFSRLPPHLANLEVG